MNRSVLSLCVSAALLLSSCGDKHEKMQASDVPPAVITSFSNAYPGAADTKWEKENEDGKTIYEAHFSYDGKKKKACYDDVGNPTED